MRAIYPVFRVLFPNQVIPADDLARAMVDVAVRETQQTGGQVFENRDIRAMVGVLVTGTRRRFLSQQEKERDWLSLSRSVSIRCVRSLSWTLFQNHRRPWDIERELFEATRREQIDNLVAPLAS